jgi:dihydroxy-acid dehydratase
MPKTKPSTVKTQSSKVTSSQKNPAKKEPASPVSLERKHSAIVLDGYERAASRGMLYAMGFKKSDFKKSQVGIASTWGMVTPCNMHINELADFAAKGVDRAGGKSNQFNTITISDGISMGTEGMKYSLVSREVIADSIETVVGCQGYDGVIAIGGCDKHARLPDGFGETEPAFCFCVRGYYHAGSIPKPRRRHYFHF